MSDFYVKSKSGEFLPVELNSYVTKSLNGKLVIIRVGNDNQQASLSDIDATWESFSNADAITSLSDVSVIVTPYQIDINTISKEDIDGKTMYLQITDSDNVGSMNDILRKTYRRLSKKFKTVVLPIPLTIKEYKKIGDILRRCKIKRDRRGRARG